MSPCRKIKRGQSSLEALIAFAALLSAIVLLSLHAQGMSGNFASSVAASAEKARLSYLALSLDTASSSLPSVYIGKKEGANPAIGRLAIVGGSNIPVSEPLFYPVSAAANGEITSAGRARNDA
jgi:hypothetical protein